MSRADHPKATPTTRAVLAVAFLLTSTATAAPWRSETGLPSTTGSDTTPAERDVQPHTIDGHALPALKWQKLLLGVIADAFVGYRLSSRQGKLFHDFELGRVQVTGWASYSGLAALNVTFETVRSSGGASYFGVDGDSIVVRAKWAYAEVTPLRRWLAIRAGLIPDLLLQHAEVSWLYRVQGPTGLERDQLFTTADVGASVEAALPLHLGSVALAYTTGEGLRLREQNNGKDLTLALRLAPLRDRLPGFLLHVLYRDGSVGAGSAANSRLAGGATLATGRLGLGALGTWALGYRGVGNRDAGHLSIWARGTLPHDLFVFARLDALWPDAHDAGSLQLRPIVGAGITVFELVRFLVSYEGVLPRGALEAQVPSVREHALLVQIEGRL